MKPWLLWFAFAAVVIALCWRPLSAWWYLDIGNIALVRGDRIAAADDFSRGLALEPAWRALREDHGRAVLDADPATALTDFRAAECGQPCLAEAGDAESRVGDARGAVTDYLAAHAVERVGATVGRLADEGRYAEAIALERELIARLGSGMLAEADLASAHYAIGELDERAAARHAATAAHAYRMDAIRSFRVASQLAPFNEGYLLALGFAQSAWGDRRAAREAFERVLELHPGQSDAERGLAKLRGAASSTR